MKDSKLNFLARSVILMVMLVCNYAPTWAANYIKGSWDGWTEHDITLTKTYTVTLAANTTYEFGLKDTGTSGSGNDWFGNTGTMTSTNCTGWNFVKSGPNCHITTKAAGTYTFKLVWNGGTPQFSVTYPEGGSDDDANDKFYLVSSQFGHFEKSVIWDGSKYVETKTWRSDADQKLESFRFRPMREYNGDGHPSSASESNRYYTLTLRDVDFNNLIAKEGVSNVDGDNKPGGEPDYIDFIIVNGNGTVFYEPTYSDHISAGFFELDSDHKTYSTAYSASNVNKFRIYKSKVCNRGGSGSGNNGSVEILLDRSASGDGNGTDVNPNVKTVWTSHMNYAVSGYNYTKNNDIYMIGNIDNVASGGLWASSLKKNRKMTKLYWKDGMSSMTLSEVASSVEECDSIIYSYTVTKPSAGWGNLFLGAAQSKNFEGSFKWNIFRPILWNYDWWDATALRGGLFIGDHEDGPGGGKMFAINPVVPSSVSSYIFEINPYNSTYNITLLGGGDGGLPTPAFQIIGPATKEASATYNDNQAWLVEHAKDMTYDESCNGYVVNVRMTQGKPFRFILNKSFANNYGEDAVAPAEYQSTHKYYNNGREAADANEAYPQSPFCNIVSYNLQGTNYYDATKGKDIIWQWATGDYTIRFFNKVLDNQQGSDAIQWYTVDYDIPLAEIKASDKLASNSKGYTYMKNWSDFLSYNLPDDMDVYYVSDYSNGTTYLTSVSSENKYSFVPESGTEYSYNYMPANEGLLIFSKTANHKASVNFSNPWKIKTSTTNNNLRPVVYYTTEGVTQSSTEGGVTVYNYGFGTKNNDTRFYLLAPDNEYISARKAKLVLSQELHDLKSSSDFNPSVSGSNAKGIGISFDEFVDEDNTTAISTSVSAPAGDGHFYNLQGVRIDRPTKGLYILNGRKVIVK